jgi:hypothetical protein
MKNLQIHIEIDDNLFLKNPDSSELGRRIISNSIEMIHKLGFELFTFKKLGIKIASPESSIYRYFENKHNLLIYLVSWYWSWIEYQLVFSTMNVESPMERLEKAIEILVDPSKLNNPNNYIDVDLLSEIIITESVKAYHTKHVDADNKKGFFKTYKQVVQRVSDLVIQCNPNYEFPHMLISTVIEGAHHQRYFAQHLPRLTDVKKGKDCISEFYTNMVLRLLND